MANIDYITQNAHKQTQTEKYDDINQNRLLTILSHGFKILRNKKIAIRIQYCVV